MIIKLCGIKKTEDAIHAINSGANWIGIIRHPASPRYCSLERANMIVDVCRKLGAEPVAVFVDNNAVEMESFCTLTGTTHVQLHGSMARSQHHLLPDHIARIYVRHVTPEGCCIADTDAGQKYLKPTRDYLLFDGLQGGSGQRYNTDNLNIPPSFKFIIAGGVASDNVSDIMQQSKPDGIDICSGIESAPGVKDQEKITRICNAIASFE